MKTITNKTLWSKAGFVEFADRDAAVAFYKACCSRNLAVAAGVYQSEATGWAFYYIAKAGGNALDRIDDYASYIEAIHNDQRESLAQTFCGQLALDAEMQRENALDAAVAHRQFDSGVTDQFGVCNDPIHHYPMN
tara:strand:+ start:7311 stop:7715 length:405 start_codon:yes stop_codon:yes gene_type:complete